MTDGAPDVSFMGQARTVDIGGVHLEIVIKGRGDPLLFLHGLDGVEKAGALIDALAETYTVYAPSHPGFGATSLPEAFTTVDDLSYFYLDVLEHLDLAGAIVVGFCFGGWVAVETLTKDCSRASALVLGAPLGLPTADRRTQRVADIFMLDGREVQARMQVTPAQESGPGALPEAVLERSVRNAEAAARFGWSPYFSNPKLASRLHRLRVPTHVVWGEDDRITPLAYGRDYAARIPGASFDVLSGCGHRIHIDRPDAAVNCIHQFVTLSAAAAA